MNKIEITITDIEKTSVYRKSHRIRRKMLRSRKNLEIISHGLTVIKNIGFEKWLKQQNVSSDNYAAIVELLRLKL